MNRARKVRESPNARSVRPQERPDFPAGALVRSAAETALDWCLPAL